MTRGLVQTNDIPLEVKHYYWPAGPNALDKMDALGQPTTEIVLRTPFFFFLDNVFRNERYCRMLLVYRFYYPFFKGIAYQG